MTKNSARRVALAALRTWRNKNEFADQIITRLIFDSNLESADRAFAVELFYGALRNLTLLDFWISALRPTRVDRNLRDALRLGLYQLFIARIPEHAAVYETVALVGKQQRSIVNGILRSALRRTEELQTKANSHALNVRFSHPKFLVERWKKRFGQKAAEWLCAWNNQPPPIYARINQSKIDRQTFLERYRNARPIPDHWNFVELPAPADALHRGDCYVQDPSTALACELLEPKPGEKILDACAAPGGKTGYLGELMQNEGLIVACDREPARLKLLRENLRRLGVGAAKVIPQDWAKKQITPEILSESPFDRILLDAPCSNTGVMRRRVDVRWRLKPTDFQGMQARQIEIAHAVLPLLKPDGILVYSTCSFEREENQDVVHHLVKAMPMLKLENEWRSLPFRHHFDGAFAARLRKLR